MFLCNTLGDENTVMFLCSFLFFWFGLVPQSAAQSLTWPARQWIHSRSRMIPEMANYYLLLFSFFKSFEMLHLTFKKTKKQKKAKKTTKKNIFIFQQFQQWHKNSHGNGEDGLFWQKLTGINQKQSNFELSKVQFHWIAKYLCKIEIVENSIFVFQVLPPQDSKLLG